MCTRYINLNYLIDESFLSRVDIHYPIAGISELAIYKILIDMLYELINKDLIISRDPLPSHQIAKLKWENNETATESAIFKLAKVLRQKGVNGRDLRRLPFRVFSSFAMRCSSNPFKIPIGEFIEEANKIFSNVSKIATFA